MAPSHPLQPIFFRSGSSRAPEFEAAMLAGVPVGISLSDASAPFLNLVAFYLTSGATVFADSGAFGAFRAGKPLSAARFETILSQYATLAAAAVPGRLYVVAPDVVGDQTASLALLHRFAPQLVRLQDAGATVIVPLQRGGETIETIWQKARAVLRQDRLCAGLPSNAAALASDEVLGFLRAAFPDMVHFLGAARGTRFQNLLQECRFVHPACHFSYDAAVVRSLIDSLAFDESRLRDLAGWGAEIGVIDVTESYEALREGDRAAIEAAVESLSPYIDPELARSRIHACLEAGDDVVELLEELCGGYHDSDRFLSCYGPCRARFSYRTFALASSEPFAEDPHVAPRCDLLLVG